MLYLAPFHKTLFVGEIVVSWGNVSSILEYGCNAPPAN